MKLARLAILGIMIGLLATVAVLYPDAPLQPCPSGYCGQQGQTHTQADYQRFETLKTALFIVWPVGMLGLFILLRADRSGPKNPNAKRHPRFGGG
jgi:hypothetical protein